MRPQSKQVRCHPKVWGGEVCQGLRQAVVESPWLGGTTLNLRFAATWGFSVAFRRSGIDRLQASLPEFWSYFEGVLGREHNAFFFNPLVIFRGGQVEPHVDCSLRSYTAPLEPPCPQKVTVYYAQVPGHFRGGELVLSDGKGKILATVVPEADLLVQFDGHLLHQVRPFLASQEADLAKARISLVCEHYCLSPALLARVPDFHLETSKKFDDFFTSALVREGIGDTA